MRIKKGLLAVLLVLITSLPLFAQTGEKRVALVVGNGAYEVGRLTNPPNDARDMSDALKKNPAFPWKLCGKTSH
jgi:hypothetical protein